MFTEDEESKVIAEAWRRYNLNDRSTSNLAIVLMFLLGCRVGEVAALKFNDVEGAYIHIQRMEVTSYHLDSEANTVFDGRSVVDYTKSDAGDRLVYLTAEARRIIELVQESNKKYNLHDDDFVFVVHDNRKTCNTIQRVREGTLCKRITQLCNAVGIPAKSTHKIRKTYISSLIDAGMNINTIRKTVGHEDERTTYRSYCYDRRTKNEIEDEFERVIDRKKAQ